MKLSKLFFMPISGAYFFLYESGNASPPPLPIGMSSNRPVLASLSRTERNGSMF